MADLKGKKGSAVIAILTVTIEEFEIVQELFELEENVPHTPYFVRQGKKSPFDVVSRRSISQTNVISHRTAGEIIEDFFPEFLIVIGTAGGCRGRDNLTLGDVVVADYVEYAGYWKFRAGQMLERKVPFDQPSLYLHQNYIERLRVQPDEWRGHVAIARPQPGIPVLRIGSIISGDILMGDAENEFQRQVIEHFDKALAVEMEAYGVARATFESRTSVHYNPQFLVVRGICDYVNVDAAGNQEDRIHWTRYAISCAASVAFSLSKLVAARSKPTWRKKLSDWIGGEG
jgi:nucleoside phosphorylase